MPKRLLLLPLFDVGANCFKFVYVVVGRPCFSALGIVVVVGQFERRSTVYTTTPRTHLAPLRALATTCPI